MLTKQYKVKLVKTGKFLCEKEWSYLVECEEEDATPFCEDTANRIKDELSQHGKYVSELKEVKS
jgi:hypothetical protein